MTQRPMLADDSAAGDLSATINGPAQLSTYTRASRLGTRYLAAVDSRSVSTSSVRLDGATISFAASERFNMGTADFAIQADFYSQSNDGSYKGMFSLGHNTPGGTRIEAAIHSGSVHIYTDTGQWRDTGFRPSLNNWFRFRLERSGGTMRVVVNGALRWEVSNTRNYSPPSGQPAFRIGTHSEDFSGFMDNLIITSARLLAV